MIFHLSIAVDNPCHVALILAEILQGKYTNFSPCPGGYITFACDEYGTAIEVYPKKTELKPGIDQEQLQFLKNNSDSLFTATHAAISVPLNQEEIEKIGQREGWRVVRCSRDGFFDVIEFWIENSVMLELLTPEMAKQYTESLNADKLSQLFAQMNSQT